MNSVGEQRSDEQVKVAIRLRPDPSVRVQKCVWLSDQGDNELVVTTGAGEKKQIFVFDSVANEDASQESMYTLMGKDAVSHAMKGINYCLFAYGQTGAGKTYSVLGNVAELMGNIRCNSRGILPRMMEDLFTMMVRLQGNHKVLCSYMQIYNEQIFDLLSSDRRIHSIREDIKQGVFIEGLTEKHLRTYEEAMDVLLDGEKTRRMASTLMNTQSSRSHAIFTISFESDFVKEGLSVRRKSKISIIDLAGSERIKHTNVEGERLREGCSINKSLHILGNVINSLLESSKKKKHIPYRDSKLTHYLKDRLGGNAIINLLANVHPNKQYIGDTLSTLMFAKRTKILKMKVQVNITESQNFDLLRKQVRDLKEQLAEMKYLKNAKTAKGEHSPIKGMSKEKQPATDDQSLMDYISLISEFDFGAVEPNELNVFEENQKHYKALLDIYEEHPNLCSTCTYLRTSQDLSRAESWKALKKKNLALTNLLRNLPAFTKIYRENLLLKEERMQKQDLSKHITSALTTIMPSECNHFSNEQIVNYYDKVIEQMQAKFLKKVNELERMLTDLQNELQQKDRKIKELKKKRVNPPEVQDLMNENEYLKLNILTLEEQIAKLEKDEDMIKIELRESMRMTKNSFDDLPLEMQYLPTEIITSLNEILQQVKKDSQYSEAVMDEMENIIKGLRVKVIQLKNDNQRLACRERRSHHRHMSSRKDRFNAPSTSFLESLSPDLRKEPGKIFLQKDKHKEKDVVQHKEKQVCKHKQKIIAVYDNQSRQNEVKLRDNQTKLRDNQTMLRDNQTKLRESQAKAQLYFKQLATLKVKLQFRDHEIEDLKKEVTEYQTLQKQVSGEFSKTVREVIDGFRNNSQKTLLNFSKSSGRFVDIGQKLLSPRQDRRLDGVTASNFSRSKQRFTSKDARRNRVTQRK